jgi:Flp pilus assembly protein TadD
VKRRLGELDEALDLQAAALEVSPEQPDVLHELAELFARRQNSKRALELVDRALRQREDEPRLHASKARYLRDLARPGEARAVVARAIDAGVDSPALRRLRRALRRS